MNNGSELSQRILRAAEHLFFARGFANTPLRAIAAEARTSESGILRLYRSKNGLLRAVYASSWAKVNACIEETISGASARDPDPRNLLLAVARGALELYEADPLRMQFIVSSFGFRDTAGLGPSEDAAPEIDAQVRYEYHRYLRRIHDLCAAIADDHPCLGAAGVTAATLGHFATSIIYGTQVGWYMAAQEEGTAVPDLTREEVIAGLYFFLYEGSAMGRGAAGPDDHASGLQDAGGD